MKPIGVELYCQNCGHEARYDDADTDEAQTRECPKCGNWMHRDRFIVCDCGTTVYLDDSLTNECPTCGQLYNGFGQELAPRDEWDENWEDDY